MSRSCGTCVTCCLCCRTRQVEMDDGGGFRQPGIVLAAGGGDGQAQLRPDPGAPREDRVAHGVQQAGRGLRAGQLRKALGQGLFDAMEHGVCPR